MSARSTADEAVFDVSERARYELRLDGSLAGVCEYKPRPGRLAFAHVEIAPEFAGRGLGARLVRAALTDVRRRGGRVQAECPFVVEFLSRHPEFSDLVFTASTAPPAEPGNRADG